MSIKLNGLTRERRHADTADIDRLSTLDMMNVIHRDDQQIIDSITPFLPVIARIVDNAASVVSHGGRLIIVGAGASGRTAVMAAQEFAPGEHAVIGVEAGDGAANYDRGVADLQTLQFGEKDMMLALTVSGKTPWVWGAMRHAWSLNAPVAIITQDPESEAAQLAKMVVSPQPGPDVVAGFTSAKAGVAQKLILNMIATGLAVRTGRVYSNIRVDIDASNTHWAERQIAIVMAAGGCNRAVAKAALERCHHHCKTAVLMVMTGLDAWEARDLLEKNNEFIRVAVQEAP
ncbi:N-acetylmuramic acid 6-phosphate etherase [Huaxiibacter chinensis]